MECPEFTCVCPMTGQPDFATIRLRYVPPPALRRAEEPEALPLELPRRGDVPRGGDEPDLRRPRRARSTPRFLEVVGDFAVRGGIHTVVTARHGERPPGPASAAPPRRASAPTPTPRIRPSFSPRGADGECGTAGSRSRTSTTARRAASPPQVARALAARGHDVRLVEATGDLEPRDPVTRRLRRPPGVALHLALAAARFGLRGGARAPLEHPVRVRLPRAARRRGAARARPAPPDLVLQNGALFAPGLPAPYPYALLLDHTRALAMRSPAWPMAGLSAPLDYGDAWRVRETSVYRRARVLATFSENVARSLVARLRRRSRARARGGRRRERVPGRGAAPATTARTILFVGRDFARKGGPVLAEAFARLRRGSRARACSWPVRARRRALPERRSLARAGRARRARPPCSRRRRCSRCPRLREPFGLAFLDAMACAVPCVGTPIEAVPEIVDGRRDRAPRPTRRSGALADALRRAPRIPLRARAMGARGRARVASRFLWSHVAERLEEALLAALSPPGRPPTRARAARAVSAGVDRSRPAPM